MIRTAASIVGSERVPSTSPGDRSKSQVMSTLIVAIVAAESSLC
jgi:hypothetical protein